MPDGFDISSLVLAVVPPSLVISMVLWLGRLVVSRQPPSRWKEIGEALAETRAHAQRLRNGEYITEKEAEAVYAELDRFDKAHNDLWLMVDLWKTRALVARLRHPSRVVLLRSCSNLKGRVGVLRNQLRQRTPGVPPASLDRAGPSCGAVARATAPSLSTSTASSFSGSPTISEPQPSSLSTGYPMEPTAGVRPASVDDPIASRDPSPDMATAHAAGNSAESPTLPSPGVPGDTDELGLNSPQSLQSWNSEQLVLQAQEHSPTPRSGFKHTHNLSRSRSEPQLPYTANPMAPRALAPPALDSAEVFSQIEWLSVPSSKAEGVHTPTPVSAARGPHNGSSGLTRRRPWRTYEDPHQEIVRVPWLLERARIYLYR